MNDRTIAKFTTTDEQLEILSKRHMQFENKDFVKEMLFTYGYYNIINGYKEPYVIDKDGEEYYKDGVTFERLFSLFTLDSQLRDAVLIAMLMLEEHLRSITSYVIGKNFGSDHKIYLKKENYKDRQVLNPNFSLDSILETMKKTVYSPKEPIYYHRTTYKNVPPWILVKGLYMNTLVNFIRFQNKECKEELIQAAYGINPEYSSLNSIKELFVNTLFVCLDYRNLAAHGGRIYNFHPKTRFYINNAFMSELKTVIKNPPALSEHCDIGQLLFLLRLFKLKTISETIETTLNTAVTMHCSKYPEDISYISNSLGALFDIIKE